MLTFSGIHPDKSISKYIYLMQITPLDSAIDQWQMPMHNIHEMRMIRKELIEKGVFKKTSATQGGTSLAEALVAVGATSKEILKYWIPATIDHCRKTQESDPLNRI